jgi:uncharacterized membrane protein
MFLSFYIERYIGFIFSILICPLFIFILTLLIIVILYRILFKKNKNEFPFFIFSIVTLLTVFVIPNSSIPNNIALYFEIPKIEKQIQEYQRNGIVPKDMRIDNNYIAVEWLLGVTDNWSAIIYDENNELENALNIINSNKTDYFYKSSFIIYKKIFGGDLIRIMKVKNKLYLCDFT